MLSQIKYYQILLFLFLVSMESCKGQSGNTDSCKSNYKTARSFRSKYDLEMTGDLSGKPRKNTDSANNYLIKSLYFTERSLECLGAKPGVVELKIQLLFLLNRNTAAYQFVDSLQATDFKWPYVKEMYSDFFHGMSLGKKSDPLMFKKYLQDAANAVHAYILKNDLTPDMPNIDIYYDYFFMQQYYMTDAELKASFENVIKKYPGSKELLDIVYTTIENYKQGGSNQTSYPIRN